MGVSRPGQVADNVLALALDLPAAHRAALDAVSGGDQAFLYTLFTPEARNQIVFGGADIQRDWLG